MGSSIAAVRANQGNGQRASSAQDSQLRQVNCQEWLLALLIIDTGQEIRP
jgi:hypothetical protein